MRHAAQGLVRAAARAVGYEIVPHWRMDRWEMARHLQALFARLEIGAVLDVGANAGQYRDFLRQEVAFRGYIASFEPVAVLAEGLERRAAEDDGWDVFRMALGAEDAERPINVATNTTLTSFLPADRVTVPSFAAADPVARVEHVPVRRLDSVIGDLRARCDLGKIYLKMDTQGYDLEVVRGASRTLPGVAALQTEASLIPIYVGMPDWLTVLAALREAGFEITGMFPVARDRHLRLVEFDCVMVNQALLGA